MLEAMSLEATLPQLPLPIIVTLDFWAGETSTPPPLQLAGNNVGPWEASSGAEGAIDAEKKRRKKGERNGEEGGSGNGRNEEGRETRILLRYKRIE